jgi:hypothetical protein
MNLKNLLIDISTWIIMIIGFILGFYALYKGVIL